LSSSASAQKPSLRSLGRQIQRFGSWLDQEAFLPVRQQRADQKLSPSNAWLRLDCFNGKMRLNLRGEFGQERERLV
jgi:hypothetical protein